MSYRRTNYGGGRRPGLNKTTLIIGIVMAAAALFRYYSNTSLNQFTGETQQVSLTVEQEIALGLQSAPEMARQYGGLHPDPAGQDLVKRVGQRLG